MPKNRKSTDEQETKVFFFFPLFRLIFHFLWDFSLACDPTSQSKNGNGRWTSKVFKHGGKLIINTPTLSQRNKTLSKVVEIFSSQKHIKPHSQLRLIDQNCYSTSRIEISTLIGSLVSEKFNAFLHAFFGTRHFG